MLIQSHHSSGKSKQWNSIIETFEINKKKCKYLKSISCTVGLKINLYPYPKKAVLNTLNY